MVSGDSPTARQHGLGDGQSVALELELAVPAADQMAEPVVGQRGCGPGGRVQPVDGDRVRRTVRGPRVGQFRPAFDDVRAGPDAVAEFGPQGAVPVIEEQPEFPAVDAVAGEAPLGAAGSVGEADLESGRSEARSGLRREFVGGGVGLEAALGGGDHLGERGEGEGFERCAPIQVPGAAVGAEPQRVQAVRRAQDREAEVGVEGDGRERGEHGWVP